MKFSHYIRMSAAVAILLTASCNKNDPASTPEPSTELKKYQLSVPLLDGRKVIETNAQLNQPQMSVQQNQFSNAYTQITQPDSAYLKSTTLMTLNKPADFAIINCIADQHLKLTFVDSVRKLPGYPSGWTALWNTKPFVEKEAPTVLYTMQRNHLTITLSKYVTIFGFELSPNLYNTYPFSVGFYDSKQNPPVASLAQTATTPAGAKLFAVKSQKPFNVIEISFSGNEATENHPWGFAIANLRYKLCKETKIKN